MNHPSPAPADGTEDVHAEYDALLTRQGALLAATVNALRGDPPPLTSWSHRDAPDLAQQMRDRAEAAEAKVASAQALVAEWEFDRDVCLAWIQDESKHVDPDHPTRLSAMADLLNRHASSLRAALTSTAATSTAHTPHDDQGNR